MPRSNRFLITIAALLLLLPAAASARWYQVEVVVFRNLGGGGDEYWDGSPARPDFGRIVTLADGAEDTRSAAFVALTPNDMRLAGVARRLRQSGTYQSLLSAAWRQPSYGVAAARRVYLTDFSSPETEAADASISAPLEVRTMDRRQVEGIVAIKIARLMHIEVDFVLYHEGVPVRLHETRKAKLREIHYFDHPLFGVVVQVSPYVIPAIAESAAVGADEPDDEPDVPAPTN